MDFYTHGGDIYDCNLDTKTPILDFSANINPKEFKLLNYIYNFFNIYNLILQKFYNSFLF